MTKGISIHIGLNSVDASQYGGWGGQLSGCVNDANAMHDIAQQMGYNPISLLLNEQATSASVLQAIGQAAKTLESGDIFLLTYSGHGGQVPDENGDEEDGQDETWVLYDRMLIDDELYLMWSQFAAGVRIFMLSDSCHSGTITRSLMKSLPNGKRDVEILSNYKGIPVFYANLNYQAHHEQYKAIQWLATKGKKASINATVLLISGCADSQLSGDGPHNGVFTGALLQVWNNGAFRGNCAAFRSAIVQTINDDTQVPEYSVVGAANPTFEAEKPFTISSVTTASVPQISPSPLWNQGDPPIFSVSPSPNSWYAVEVATDANLFNNAANGSNRTEDNFYASWQDHSDLFSDSEYQLPQDAWTRLSVSGGQLFYRVVTSSVSNDWVNEIYSVDDDHAADAPYVEMSRAYQLA